MSHKSNKKASKFTRGEKCIFAHLIVTFALLLVLVLVYFAHLASVPHHARDALRVRRRGGAHAEPAVAATGGRAALVRAGGRHACAGVLLRARWVAAPAHCVAARNHPDMADDLPAWKILYRLQSGLLFESDVTRGVVHSHFNGDDFSNNLGLFQQADPVFVDDYRMDDTGVSDELLRSHARDATVVDWAGVGEPTRIQVIPMTSLRCRRYMAPVVDLRSYEFCVQSTTKNLSIEHGAAVFFGSEVRGFVAWGDKNGNLPLVVLDIAFYRNWIENVIKMY